MFRDIVTKNAKLSVFFGNQKFRVIRGMGRVTAGACKRLFGAGIYNTVTHRVIVSLFGIIMARHTQL